MSDGRRPLVSMAVALGSGVLLASHAATQEPSAPVRIAPVATERVQVAVVVTDRRGRAVRGLEPGDFLLLEDGKPQIVTLFMGPSPDGGTEPPEPPPRPADPRRAAAADAPAPRGRHVVLAVDDLHLAQQSLIQAKEALRRFVAEQVSEDDEVAVVTTSGGLGQIQPFTGNAWALRRAIDRVGYEGQPGSAGRVPMSEFLAESIARGDHEALGLATSELTQWEALTAPSEAGAIVNPRHVPEARSQARSVLAQALSRSRRATDVLERVLRGLAGVPGRKLAVLVSDGFLLGTGTGPEAIDLRRIFDASARSGVAVYCLDSRGLVAGAPGGEASEVAPATLNTKPGVGEGYERLGVLTFRQALSALAEGTGGVSVRSTNDLQAGLDRILRDADAAYLLGYEPTVTERNGRFRNIQVKLPGRTGLTVRARKGYFGPDDRLDARAPGGRAAAAERTRRVEELRSALGALVPPHDLPVRLAADFIHASSHQSRLVVSVDVDLSGLRVEPTSGHDAAEVEVIGVVYDERGAALGEFEPERRRLDLDSASMERARGEGLLFKRSATLPPGLYQVRVVARHATHSQLGSASEWVEIPQLGSAPLQLSSLFLFAGPPPAEAEGDASHPAEGPVAAPAGLRDAQVRRRFGPGESLYYQIYAYAPARDESGATDVVLQTQVWSGSELQGTSPLQPVAFGAAPGEPAAMSGSIALRGLGSGAYELRVLVVDRKAQTTALRRASFGVE